MCRLWDPGPVCVVLLGNGRTRTNCSLPSPLILSCCDWEEHGKLAAALLRPVWTGNKNRSSVAWDSFGDRSNLISPAVRPGIEERIFRVAADQRWWLSGGLSEVDWLSEGNMMQVNFKLLLKFKSFAFVDASMKGQENMYKYLYVPSTPPSAGFHAEYWLLLPGYPLSRIMLDWDLPSESWPKVGHISTISDRMYHCCFHYSD